ncbi:MAG: right-handed parallel beta-helix repeat-containing protein [Paludibacteraceae bacterium]|nr:right-handed parallel beta-helix repeat-containing protein [Paludibacteraceae bacterium]
MKKIYLLVAAALMAAMPMNGQFFKNLGNEVKKVTNQSSQSQSSQSSSQSSSQNRSAQSNQGSQAVAPNSGKVYYVSVNGKSRGADGLSVETAKKDIQAVLNIIKENNESGAVIRVSEGNFLGATNAGYIEISSWVTLEGGWNADFTERDPFKYITRIQPTQEQLGTNGSKGLITISGLDDVMAKKPKGTLIIDGIMLDQGLEAYYMPNDPKDERNGCPSEAFETGRMVDAVPPQVQHQGIYSQGWIAGNVIIRNCLVANCTMFGMQFSTRCGEVEIYNNVIISNRYGGVRIQGGDKNGEASHINFHHNTVAFSWCRDKYMEDMGYGYEYMTLVSADVHHNLFIGNNYAAVARTHALSGPDAPIEAKRITNLYDNYYYINAADLQLPSKGGGKWTNVKCTDIEDMVDEKTLPKAENNLRMADNDPALDAFDQDYLEGVANLKIIASSQSFNRNSASNQLRAVTGQNMQGSEIRRVSMYGNRYNFDKAMKLFGAKANYGAQK